MSKKETAKKDGGKAAAPLLRPIGDFDPDQHIYDQKRRLKEGLSWLEDNKQIENDV